MKIIRQVNVTDAILLSSNVPETDFAEWDGATTYAIGDKKIMSSVHLIYESLQAANLNNDPTLSPLHWKSLGATNRWRMFDKFVGSESTIADEIIVELIPGKRIDSVSLLNLSASTARIRQISVADGVVYDETITLNDTSGIADWYTYFFESIERKRNLTITNLLPYSDATLEITLSETGATVGIGVVLIGQSITVGDTLLGIKTGIQSFSTKERNELGEFTIVERPFSKKADFSVKIKNNKADNLQNILSDLRDTPAVYIGEEEFGSTIVYGFYADHSITMAQANESILSIRIEGLT